MIKVLFVDDEPAVLEGLENRMYRMRRQWDMRFAASGHEALDELARGSVDVIVSDMRMPGMDGAQLLEQVRERYPEIVRFILSGQTGDDGALRLMPVAHQLLTKPCDASALERSIERICCLRKHLLRPAVQQALGSLRSLPALPKLYWSLVAELQKPNSHAAAIARIIEQDVAMTARLLQMANSVFFGPGRRISSVKDAVALLGVEPIRSIVLSLQLVRALGSLCVPQGFSLETLQAHSLAVGQLAASMLPPGEARHTAFSAGMLHDLGRLVMAASMPLEWAQAQQLAKDSGRTLCAAETEVLGCDHADIGAQMLCSWGLPMGLVEVVAFHHRPSLSAEDGFGPVGAVHLANLLVAERDAGKSRDDEEYDQIYIDRAGLAAAVAGWRRGEEVRPL